MTAKKMTLTVLLSTLMLAPATASMADVWQPAKTRAEVRREINAEREAQVIRDHRTPRAERRRETIRKRQEARAARQAAKAARRAERAAKRGR